VTLRAQDGSRALEGTISKMSTDSESTTGLPLVSARDLWEVFLLCLFALPAFFAPERVWLGIARVVARARVLAGRSSFDRDARELAPAFASLGIASAPADVLVELVAQRFLRYFILLRELSPWGWHPEIELVGLENLAQARREGRGVILYVHPSVHYAIVSKKAIAGSGTLATHLSRRAHGFATSTRFGIRFLNPLATRAENRYLARRLVIRPGNDVGAVRGLIAALRAQEVVMVTANAEGHTHELPFLGGTVSLARGAVGIGTTSGAPILPLLCARQDHGRYVVEIAPRLTLDEGEKPKGEQAEKALLRGYLAGLEKFMRRHPSQCEEWQSRNRWRPRAP